MTYSISQGCSPNFVTSGLQSSRRKAFGSWTDSQWSMRFIFQLGYFPAECELDRETTLRERNCPGSGKIMARTSEGLASTQHNSSHATSCCNNDANGNDLVLMSCRLPISDHRFSLGQVLGEIENPALR